MLFLYVLFNPARVRYGVVDWYRRSNFQPTEEVETIISRIELTDEGNKLFLATQPQLVTPVEFSNFCPTNEQTNVLGCYSTDLTYLLDVEEEVLERVEDVTAVHELLHAAWARMSQGEKEDLKVLLNNVFENSDDERLINLIDSYRQSNSGDDPLFIANELHSILGTEVLDLPIELEDHYAKYLKNRTSIVDMFTEYNSEFERREERVAQLQKKMTSLKSEIEEVNDTIDQLTARNDELVAEIQRLRDQGKTAESNQIVVQQNIVVNQIRREVDYVNSLISEFNNAVEENNSLALELNQLVESLDSRSAQ